MKRSTAFWAGVSGALMMSLVTAVARATGVPMNLEMMIGSAFTGATTGGTWFLGLVVHLLVGGVFGLIYAGLFERITHRAGVGIGVVIGTVHGILSGLMLGLMPAIHPLMPETIAAPGMFALSIGAGAALLFIALHMAFGAVVGGVYAPVIHTRAQPAPTP